MRTSMAIPIRFRATLLAGLMMYQYSINASADWCEFKKEIDLTLDVSDSDTLVITAAISVFWLTVAVPSAHKMFRVKLRHLKTASFCCKQGWADHRHSGGPAIVRQSLTVQIAAPNVQSSPLSYELIGTPIECKKYG